MSNNEYPYGLKKDGTPAKKRGRKPADEIRTSTPVEKKEKPAAKPEEVQRTPRPENAGNLYNPQARIRPQTTQYERDRNIAMAAESSQKIEVIVSEDVIPNKRLKQLTAEVDLDAVDMLVRNYYRAQDDRIRVNAQYRERAKILLAKMGVSKVDDLDEEQRNKFHMKLATLSYLAANRQTEEDAMKVMLSEYARRDPVGQWLLSNHGVGPVIAAGLLSTFRVVTINPETGEHDAAVRPYAGAFHSFAGIHNPKKWEKGQKRPWSAMAKQLAYKLGHSFMMQHKHEKCFYGHLYAQRKAYEINRNLQDHLLLNATNFSEDRYYFIQAILRNCDYYGSTTDAWAWVNGCYHPRDVQGLLDEFAAMRREDDKLPEKDRKLKKTDTALSPERLQSIRRKPCTIVKTGHRFVQSFKGYTSPGEEFEEYEVRLNPSIPSYERETGIPMLPPGQIDARARRYAAKIFISHMHHVMWVNQFGEAPPKPYPIAFGIGGTAAHTGYIDPSGFKFDVEKGRLVATNPIANEDFDEGIKDIGSEQDDPDAEDLK